jgi:chemotaxis regulatin CheY-phosphate phosphatase CheZ
VAIEFFYYYYFNCRWISLPSGSGTTRSHNTQVTLITTPKQNTTDKTSQTIKNTIRAVNTMQIQLINITINTITIKITEPTTKEEPKNEMNRSEI